jgi:hypothetical protein
VPSDVANKQADLVDRRLDAVTRQSDRNCTDAHLEKHLSKLRGWEMAYKVVVRPNPSQNNSTGPEAGQGWKQSPNADVGDKDTAIRLEMYIKPRKKEVTDQRTGKDSHQLKEVRSDRDKNTPHQPKKKKKEAYLKSPKLNKKGGTRLLLAKRRQLNSRQENSHRLKDVKANKINTHTQPAKKKAHLKSPKTQEERRGHAPSYNHHTACTFTCQHHARGAGGPGLSKQASLRPDCACWLWISIAISFFTNRGGRLRALERMTGLRGVSTTKWCDAHVRVLCGGGGGAGACGRDRSGLVGL